MTAFDRFEWSGNDRSHRSDDNPAAKATAEQPSRRGGHSKRRLPRRDQLNAFSARQPGALPRALDQELRFNDSQSGPDDCQEIESKVGERTIQ
jgi:hypothetical protein